MKRRFRVYMTTKKRITGFLTFALIVAVAAGTATYTIQKNKVAASTDSLIVSTTNLIIEDDQASQVEVKDEDVISASTRAAQVKWERDKSRSQEKENVTRIIQDNLTNAEDAEKYQSNLLAMAENGRKEGEAEAILKALGFGDTVVNLSDSEISANVLIFGNELDEISVMKIGNAVADSTGVPIQKIYIVDKL